MCSNNNAPPKPVEVLLVVAGIKIKSFELFVKMNSSVSVLLMMFNSMLLLSLISSIRLSSRITLLNLSPSSVAVFCSSKYLLSFPTKYLVSVVYQCS